ncbi:cornifelin homolog [Bufo gargarizans]|uniref:cornifelin homolog n=1 Tax=Bufo gargarizans TaxID=30331 RepID=UPI001CF42644|nr:cornifelin homolog [Bufo gargarizans]
MSYPVSAQPQAMQGYSTSTSQWNSDVMDCCEDMGICLCGAFVPCILACRVASDFGECCCLPCLPGTLLAMRTGVRERYHIPGTICNDCVCLTFCGQCTLCQLARELKQRT